MSEEELLNSGSSCFILKSISTRSDRFIMQIHIHKASILSTSISYIDQ